MLKGASQWFESIKLKSSPSYVSSLVTPCSSLQSRRAIADLLSHDHLEKLKTVHLLYCTWLNGTSCRTSFANLHHYRFVKLTSRHTCSKFIIRLDLLLLRAFV